MRLDPAWAFAALASHATNLAVLRRSAVARLAALAVSPCGISSPTPARAAAIVTREAGRAGTPVEPAPLLEAITADTTTVAVGDSLAVLHEPSGKVHVLSSARVATGRSRRVQRLQPGRVDRGRDDRPPDVVRPGGTAWPLNLRNFPLDELVSGLAAGAFCSPRGDSAAAPRPRRSGLRGS